MCNVLRLLQASCKGVLEADRIDSLKLCLGKLRTHLQLLEEGRAVLGKEWLRA